MAARVANILVIATYLVMEDSLYLGYIFRSCSQPKEMRDSLGPVRNPQFFIDMMYVVFDGRFTNREAGRYFPVGHSIGN